MHANPRLSYLCYFAVLGLALAIAHPAHTEIWARYAQLGSHLVLTALIFGSILAGHPFTEAYARNSTPPELWHTRQLRNINRRISGHLGPRLHHRRHLLALAGSVSSRQVLLVRRSRFSCAFARVLPGAGKSGPYGCAYVSKRN